MTPKNNKPQDTEAEIEHKVDQIMDPNLPDPAPAEDGSKMKGAPKVPEIDIFENSDPIEIKVKKGVSPSESTSEEVAETPAPGEPAAEPAPEEKIIEDPSIDSAEADPLVDDIVAKEGDELLEAKDAEVAQAFVGRPETFRERLKNFFDGWWQNKTARYGTLTVLAAIALTVGVIPSSRYFVLNSAGVRAGASLTILDGTTDLPLKNVSVTLGNQTARTNQDGVARMQRLKLGTQELTVKQLGFAAVTRAVTLGLGSNPLGEVELKAVGTQFTFKLTDYVSGKPVGNAEASSGEANAQSNEKGEIILTIGAIEEPRLDVTLTAGGYRTEKITIPTSTTAPTDVVMVTKRKEVFVSKQSGKYDVYKIDVDGKNKQLLLAGTGNERSQITLVPHATDEMVALVSSRDSKRNGEGYLLDTLTLIDVDDGSMLTLEHSERIQIVDWIKDKLVYVKIKAGTSAGNSERNQLMSYDYTTTTRLQLAAANSFPDIVSAKGALYYVSANYYTSGQPQFVKINPDNTGKQTLLTADIWNILRSGYEDLHLAGSQGWYAYRLGDTSAKKMSQAPANTNETRFYLDAPDGKRSLWTEQRDGKGVLLTYDSASKKDTAITAQSGLTYPLRWLDSRTAVYRIATGNETASYVVSMDGGSPKKITDMTNANGLSRWHNSYY